MLNRAEKVTKNLKIGPRWTYNTKDKHKIQVINQNFQLPSHPTLKLYHVPMIKQKNIGKRELERTPMGYFGNVGEERWP